MSPQISCILSHSASSPIRSLTRSSCTSHSAGLGTANLPASISPGFARSTLFSLFASVRALAQSFIFSHPLHEEAKRGFDGLERPFGFNWCSASRRLTDQTPLVSQLLGKSQNEFSAVVLQYCVENILASDHVVSLALVIWHWELSM